MNNKRIGIVGAGNWGTVLAIYLENQGRNPVLYEYFKDRAECLNKERENKKYLKGYELNKNILITNSVDEIMSMCDVIFFVQPSHTLKNIASIFKNYINDKIIASFTKGIDPDTLQRMSEILEDLFPNQKEKIIAVSGPSIAREVVRNVPTSMVAASKDIKRARIIQNLLSGNIMRVYTSNDIVGVELGGALKNVYAIASGICDGMSLGMNAKAALLTRSMHELSRLGIKMGGDELTFAGLSGFGDLIVTSFSPHSRNRTVGERLGKGENLEEILEDMVEVAEGVRTTKSISSLSRKYNVELPIAKEVYNVLFENKNPKDSILDLMQRELKMEER
jgi:glycerol-3-phosphate dehydrogenase (NAD(P)+)